MPMLVDFNVMTQVLVIGTFRTAGTTPPLIRYPNLKFVFWFSTLKSDLLIATFKQPLFNPGLWNQVGRVFWSDMDDKVKYLK